MDNAWGDVPSVGGVSRDGVIDTFASSSVVNLVFDRILQAVHEGRLLPGDRISDSDFAEELGVSRTPVREAFQRLREIGIVEASANRFTRIAIVSPKQTAQAMVVWTALYSALVNEVIERVPPEMVAAMNADHERFIVNMFALEMQSLATANADFFAHLVFLSKNPALQRTINSVVHVIRLGSLHLPDYIDFRALSQSQELLVAAARDHDRAAGQGALRMLGLISVPTSPPVDDTADSTTGNEHFCGAAHSQDFVSSAGKGSIVGAPVASIFEQAASNQAAVYRSDTGAGTTASSALPSQRELRRQRRKEHG